MNRLWSVAVMLVAVAWSGSASAAILYDPPEKMWDTWVYQDGEDYHLFFLSQGTIGRAVSQDLINWKHLPPIPNMAAKGDWDERGMRLTGCTVKHDGKYYMSYGSGEGSPIGFLVSDDLMNWKRFLGRPLLPSKAPYKVGSHWRDLSSYYDEQERQWHGFVFGIDEKSDLPCIAHVTSKNYVDWKYLDPVFISEPYTRDNDGFVYLEVPDQFEINGKHYIVFSSVRSRKNDTSGRKDASGTWYLIGDSREGPYHVPDRPLLVGSGRGRYDHYVGRTLTYQGKRLLYHQTWGEQPVCWGSLKEVHQNDDGTLALKYWSNLDKLQQRTLLELDRVELDAPGGRQAFKLLNAPAADVMITCDIDASRAKSAGLVWRSEKGGRRSDRDRAAGLRIDRTAETVSIVNVEHPNEKAFNAETVLTHLKDDYKQEGLGSKPINVRIMVRGHMAEVYIDNRWVFTTGIEDAPATGDIGLWADSGAVTLTNLKVSELEPLDDPSS